MSDDAFFPNEPKLGGFNIILNEESGLEGRFCAIPGGCAVHKLAILCLRSFLGRSLKTLALGPQVPVSDQ